MEIRLDRDFSFVTKEGKLDQKKLLKNAGVKAAVCYKKGSITPEEIRNTESDEVLIKRGLDTIMSGHTTPSEQQQIGLEITNIPKILCMVLNNEKEYTSDERSLRYTKVEKNDYLSEKEVLLYEKWMILCMKTLQEDYKDFFEKYFKDEKQRNIAIKRLAQENARYMTTVFMPTTITYSVPFIQINKIVSYMDKFIQEGAKTPLEEKLIPYFEDFKTKLKDLGVILTKSDAKRLCPTLDIEDNDELLYKNSKQIDLSLFARKNKFSGIEENNEFGASFSYNFYPSFASLAQFHRHRTIDFEMKELDHFYCFTPAFIAKRENLRKEWVRDMKSVRDIYPQGQIVKANASGTLKNLVHFVGKERACDNAQFETESIFVNELLTIYYDNLKYNDKNHLVNELKPYVRKLRCAYPDFKCPKPCGHPRLNREF